MRPCPIGTALILLLTIAAGADGAAPAKSGRAAASPAVALDGKQFPGLDDRWLEIATGEFRVLSNAPRKRVVGAIDNLQAFRAVLGSFLPALRQAPRRQTIVYLFDGSREFRVYATDAKNVIGFFASRPEANYIAVDGNTQNPYATVFHEYVHYLLRNNVPTLPLWLNEGLAEYFEGFRTRKGHGEFGGDLGWGQYLATHDWLDYGEVLTAGGSSRLYRDPALSARFRGQAWALTHLLYDASNRPLLIATMQALSQGVDSRQAVLSSLGITAGQLEPMVRSHLRKVVQQTRLVELRSLPIAPTPEPREIPRVEVLTRLAQLLAIRPTDDRAAQAHLLLDEVLRPSRELTPALVTRARLRILGGDTGDETPELLDEAIALDPTGPDAYYLRGGVYLDRSGEPDTGLSTAVSANDALELARDDYRTVLRLDPNYREATNQLAHTYLFDRATAPLGIELAQGELRQGPHLFLAVTLMELYARVGDRDSARRVHDEMISRWLDALAEGDPTRLLKAIDRTDVLVARAWMEDGRCGEARELLKDAARRTAHEDLRTELRSLVDGLGDC